MYLKIFILFIIVFLLAACDDTVQIASAPDINSFLPDRPNVEVNLGPAMLNLLGGMTGESEHISNIVQGLTKISVKVYDLDEHKDIDVEALRGVMDQQAKWLESQDYQPLAMVKEDDSLVYIMAQMSNQTMQGIRVYALEDEDELVLIDIGGELKLDDLNQLMEHFDVNLKDLDL